MALLSHYRLGVPLLLFCKIVAITATLTKPVAHASAGTCRSFNLASFTHCMGTKPEGLTHTIHFISECDGRSQGGEGGGEPRKCSLHVYLLSNKKADHLEEPTITETKDESIGEHLTALHATAKMADDPKSTVHHPVFKHTFLFRGKLKHAISAETWKPIDQ